MSDIETSNVYHLVALASRISLRPKAEELRLSCTEYLHLPVFWFVPFSNPCSREQKESRFARLLDSITNLSVSAPQHEVIAIAFCPTASSLSLLMAGNEQVHISTTDHIGSLWVAPKTLSRLQTLQPAFRQIHISFTTQSLPITFSYQKTSRRIPKDRPEIFWRKAQPTNFKALADFTYIKGSSALFRLELYQNPETRLTPCQLYQSQIYLSRLRLGLVMGRVRAFTTSD